LRTPGGPSRIRSASASSCSGACWERTATGSPSRSSPPSRPHAPPTRRRLVGPRRPCRRAPLAAAPRPACPG
jgi:hypothetical protein